MEKKYYFDKEVYSKPGHEFRFEFEKEVIDIILKHKNSGNVLDLGCGEGGNSIELAKHGFEVTCVDISETVIKRLKEFCSKNSIAAKIICADLDRYIIDEKYDIILSTGVYHFLSQGEIYRLLGEARKMTNKNGLNIFYVLLEGDPTQAENPGGHYFRRDELESVYVAAGWNIIAYEEFFEFDDSTMINHKMARLVAKKVA